MNLKKVSIFIAFLFIIGSVSAGSSHAFIIIEQNPDQSTILLHQESLADDSEDLTGLIIQVKESMVLGYISSLVGFGPRVTGTSACDDAGNYIASTMSGMGLDVEIQPWSSGGNQGNNIEATLEGEDASSDEIYIVCGHYDSVSGSPGADDNAAGTAAVMAAANVMSQYSFSHTVRFVTFSGEEQGLLGSSVYADNCAAQNQNIVEVINADMIGYTNSDVGKENVHVYGSGAIASQAQMIGNEYDDLIGLNVDAGSASANSDHWPFIQNGYDAAMFHEYDFNDYYHSPQDTIDKMDMDYDMRVTRMILGTLVSFADFIPPSQGGSGFLPLVVDVEYPVRDQVVNGTVVISGTARHPESDAYLKNVGVQIDDLGWEMAEGTVEWEYVWDTTSVSDGFHKIKAISSDGSLQSGMVTVPVIVNNLNEVPDTPVIIEAPTTGYTEKTYTFTVQSTDQDNDDIRYGFDWNNDNIIDGWTPMHPSGESVSISHSWPFGSAGTYDVRVIAEDSLGEQSQFSPATQITIEKSDTTPPTVSIEQPENAIYVNKKSIIGFFNPIIFGPVDIIIAADDADSSISTIHIYINEVKEHTFTGEQEEYTWTWDTSGFGQYMIKSEAIDLEGNINTIEQSVFKML
jgi:hypothetical protein